jgi:hypothetical protein
MNQLLISFLVIAGVVVTLGVGVYIYGKTTGDVTLEKLVPEDTPSLYPLGGAPPMKYNNTNTTSPSPGTGNFTLPKLPPLPNFLIPPFMKSNAGFLAVEEEQYEPWALRR